MTTHSPYLPAGILVPMEEEIQLLISQLTQVRSEIIANRTFYSGKLAGNEVVVCRSGIGKVAAAFTASLFIHRFGVKSVLISGVAGGIADHIFPGDLAIALEAVQHDMDCRPLFPQFEIPLSGISFFKPEPVLTSKLEKAATEFLKTELEVLVPREVREEIGIQSPQIFQGRLASGDQFIGTFNQWEKIRAEIMDILFVEMEGAAVAQVCYDSSIPWCSIRTISDKANAAAHVDFNLFLNKAARLYTAGIVKNFIAKL